MTLAELHASAFETPWSQAEIDGLIAAGAVALTEEGGFILIREGGGEAEILTLAVHRDRRRHGIGRRLVERAAGAATTMGASVLFLEVAADNLPAIALYREMGFKQRGVRPKYYQRSNLQMQDAIIFARALNSG